MSITKLFRKNPQQKKGAALIIVLAFVVLLTGVTVAFLVQSISSRMISNSSASQNKAALLAQSALDIIVSDLRQEIADPANSTVTTYGTAPNQSQVYVPILPANAVPLRIGNPALIPASGPTPAIDPIPNLLRVSIRQGITGVPLTDPSKASPISSTAPAKDGRFISPARWNSHYLIPRFNAGAAIDSTPDPTLGFRPPDWVLVTRTGPAIKSAMGSGPTALNNPVASNNDYVIGRYAFAVYDEGGLLDINVAGYPSPASTPAPTPNTPAGTAVFTQTQVSEKISLAMADLTKLPLVQAPTNAPGDYLTQAQVDSIVGWRNKASGTPTGGFPNFTFSVASAASWFTLFATGNNNGYMQVYGTLAGSDQAFLSRKQLLQMRSALGLSQNLLQYLGTFSRGLEQPSFVPPIVKYPSLAPTIVSTSNPPPAVATPPVAPNVPSNYYGNNDKVGQDANINVSLLAARATSAFARYDDIPAVTTPPSPLIPATTAVIGEPLVKTKFPLSRLALITPSSTANTTSNIYKYFGISRTSSTAPWVYNHGGTNGAIKTMAEVAALGREPDFAELLKATISVGSLGKGAPNLHDNQLVYSYALDVSVDYQVLQIMANLIDQYDTDSYPTVISSSTSNFPIVTRNFRGMEDIPYFYRWHPVSVVTRAPSPLLERSDTVHFDDGRTDDDGNVIGSNLRRARTGSAIADPGEVVHLWVPELWNPNDPNNVLGQDTSTRPQRFRVLAVTGTPQGTLTWTVKVKPGSWDVDGNRPQGLAESVASTNTTYINGLTSRFLSTANSSMEFSDVNGTLFREPTLVMRDNAPAGSAITLGAGNSLGSPVTDINTGKSYLGMLVGKSAIVTTFTSNTPTAANPAVPPATTSTTSVPYIVAATALDQVTTLSTNAKQQVSFILQYQIPSTNTWITYDEKNADMHAGHGNVDIALTKGEYTNGEWWNPWRNDQFGSSNSAHDPRTIRWGMGLAHTWNTGGPTSGVGGPGLEPAMKDNYLTNQTANNSAIGASNFTVLETDRPRADKGNYVNYSNPCQVNDPSATAVPPVIGRAMAMRWISGDCYGNTASNFSPLQYSGLLSQNDPAIVFPARNGVSNASFMYQDPDGVVRRGMAAYASTALPVFPILGSVVGMPHAPASTYAATNGVGEATVQSQSRTLILNRPFRSVAEMSYAFRGTPWKNIDFFTPESADTGLLDVFCLNQAPQNGIVAGKVNLNTRQIPVLAAILSGAYKDEIRKQLSAPAYSLAPINAVEATNIATALTSYTMNATGAAWRGPLTNIAELVGRLVQNPGTPVGTDFYKYQSIDPFGAGGTGLLGTGTTGPLLVFSGPMAAFGSTVFTNASTDATIAEATQKIQRFREAALRPLVNCGQTRVWNLLVDVIAQSGRYTQASGANPLEEFVVEGEKRYWLHIAIDRYTGQVIDKQLEPVTE